jgi:hypothetical protein
VKIVREESLISCGDFSKSPEWAAIRKKLHKAIKSVEWPPGSGSFTIYPQSGRKRGEGNGVVPIKAGLMLDLKKEGWSIEAPAKQADEVNPGDYDAVLQTKAGPIVVEWETGNISSSHRSLNKMSLGIMRGKIAAGILIVPSRELYKYLTDRVGNMRELEPYLDLWRAIPCKHGGVLEIVVIEYDATSMKVPRIKKGTDGRALA